MRRSRTWPQTISISDSEKENADLRPALSNPDLAKNSARAATSARTTTAASTTPVCTGTGAEYRLRLHRQQAFALQLLAGQLARAAHGLGLFTGFLLGRLFVMAAKLHLAEN